MAYSHMQAIAEYCHCQLVNGRNEPSQKSKTGRFLAPYPNEEGGWAESRCRKISIRPRSTTEMRLNALGANLLLVYGQRQLPPLDGDLATPFSINNECRFKGDLLLAVTAKRASRIYMIELHNFRRNTE